MPLLSTPPSPGNRSGFWFGAVAQLVRAPPCHGGGCEFEPRRFRQFPSHKQMWELAMMGSMNREPAAFEQRVHACRAEHPVRQGEPLPMVAKKLHCGSSQSIGQALKGNPFAPGVPCHRVVTSALTPGGFNLNSEIVPHTGNGERPVPVVHWDHRASRPMPEAHHLLARRAGRPPTRLTTGTGRSPMAQLRNPGSTLSVTARSCGANAGGWRRKASASRTAARWMQAGCLCSEEDPFAPTPAPALNECHP